MLDIRTDDDRVLGAIAPPQRLRSVASLAKERVARFEREARSAGLLNHPHVAQGSLALPAETRTGAAVITRRTSHRYNAAVSPTRPGVTVRRYSSNAEADRHDAAYWRQLSPADRRDRGSFGELAVDFIGWDAFVRNKRATGRPKDLGDIDGL